MEKCIKLQNRIDHLNKEHPTLNEDVDRLEREYPDLMREIRLKRSIREKNIGLAQEHEENDRILHDIDVKVNDAWLSGNNPKDLSEWT